MRTTSRLIRTVLVAAGLLAISASAAQAMPSQASTDVREESRIRRDGPSGRAITSHHLRVMSHSAAVRWWFTTVAASCSATS